MVMWTITLLNTIFTDETLNRLGLCDTGITYSTDYYQRLTLYSWLTACNLKQTPLNRSQQLPAPQQRLIRDFKQRLRNCIVRWPEVFFFPATGQCPNFKVPRRRQRSKRRSLMKSQFAFFQTFFHYNKSLILSNEGKLKLRKKVRPGLCTSSIKREIRHFHVAIVQWWQWNVDKTIRCTCKVVDLLIIKLLTGRPTLPEYVEYYGWP